MLKKILHMTPPEVKNGVYQYLFNNMQYIDLNEYRFSFLMRNEKELQMTKEYKKYKFDIQTFSNTERDNREGLIKEIKEILEQGYDAIHLHTGIWRGFLIEEIAMEMGIPQVIVHSHSSGIDVADNEERESRLKLHNAFKSKFNMNYATDLCACSKLAANWLYGEQIERQSIRLLPNAIDVCKYHYQPTVRKKLRNRMGLSDKIVIGHIGRYCYQKNQDFLIRTFEKAKKRNPKLVLLLLGQGELMEQYQKLIMKLEIQEDVKLIGWQDNVEEYLQIMDVFTLPSRFEGLPISLIEAQTAGLKCFVSNHVTEEVKITELVHFLPLIEEVWIEKMAEIDINVNRERFDEQINRKGFDIRTAADKLVQLYN